MGLIATTCERHEVADRVAEYPELLVIDADPTAPLDERQLDVQSFVSDEPAQQPESIEDGVTLLRLQLPRRRAGDHRPNVVAPLDVQCIVVAEVGRCNESHPASARREGFDSTRVQRQTGRCEVADGAAVTCGHSERRQVEALNHVSTVAAIATSERQTAETRWCWFSHDSRSIMSSTSVDRIVRFGGSPGGSPVSR